MEIFDKAKELGKLIAESDLSINLKKYEAILTTDEASLKMITEFNSLQKTMVDAVSAGSPEDEIEVYKLQLASKYDELYDYEVTGNYFKAKDKFDAIMKQMNDIIVFEITGEQKGCSSDGCTSCSGCH